LLANGKAIGTVSISMTRDSGRSFTSEDLLFTQLMAGRCAVMIDNARLYRESRRARLVADSLPALIAYWDRDLRCQFANRAYLRWFGIDPEDLIGRPMLEVLGPELFQMNRSHIQAALQGIPQYFELDLRLHATGEVRHANATYVPEVVEGRVLGFFVLVTDVTDLKDAQLAALSEKKIALSAVETREEVLTVVAHDLKSPLSAVGLAAQLQLQLNASDIRKIHDFSSRIQRSVETMQALIGDLLDFARLQAGSFTVDRHRCNAASLISQVLDSLQGLAQAKRQVIEIVVPADLPDLDCDPNRMRQVLANILGNAIKFAPNGGEIRISASLARDEILISVRDNGPGIPPEHLEKVFDRYWQGHEARRMGTGLGLAIAKSIVESHRGKIWVESEPGKGSCFHFTIPLATPATRPADP
jgi:two-component system sensor histidine kinase/response regulator